MFRSLSQAVPVRSAFAPAFRAPFRAFASAKTPKKIAVTGAAGQIGYALVFRIASGALLGPDQPVILHCIELPNAMNALKGVAMELDDCAFPLLKKVVQTDNLEKGFEDVDYAILVGSKPRSAGMERADLLKENGKIFVSTGKALNAAAKKTARILVVGNPANTNCLIAAANAPNIPAENFSAMTRLDHNRALSALAVKAGVDVTDVSQVAIWGNHSSTQYPDINSALIKGQPARKVINDDKWVQSVFIPEVQQRGAAIIKARGASSAASAANAAIDHVHDWALGSNGKWVSMAMPSDDHYGVGKGIYFSYPFICQAGHKLERQNHIKFDEFSQQKIESTKKELFEERDMVKHMIP